jgi:hypothetical protein
LDVIMPPLGQRFRTSSLVVPFLLAGMVLLVLAGSWGAVADAGTATEPTNAPSTNPPQPTSQPQPTDVPPTSVPPTDIPATEVPATEVPATEAPTEAPTEVPTEVPPTATLTPAPFPTNIPAPPPPDVPVVRPSPTPAVAGEATVTCAPASGMPALAAGGDEWVLHACTLALDFGPVEAVDIRASAAPGWRIILVARDARETPGLLDASNSRLAIDDLEGATTAGFLLGARASCTAVTATTLEFEITGTGPDGAGAVTATGTVDLAATGAGVPGVQLAALDIAEGEGGTQATVEIDYQDASTVCGWQLLVTLGATDSGMIVPPDGAMTLASVTGPDEITSATGDGVVSVLVPASGGGAGMVTITVLVDSQGGAPAFDAVIVDAFPAP